MPTIHVPNPIIVASTVIGTTTKFIVLLVCTQLRKWMERGTAITNCGLYANELGPNNPNSNRDSDQRGAMLLNKGRLGLYVSLLA